MPGLIFRPVPKLAFRLSLAGYLLFRIALASLPGYTWDVEMIKTWSLGIAMHGLSRTYAATSVDYPPLYVYLIQPVGNLYLALHPELRDAKTERRWDELLFETEDGERYRSKWEIRQFMPPAAGAGPLPDSRLLYVLIKLPAMAFDFAAAAILYALVAGSGTWGAGRKKPGWGRLAASLYLWNPAVLWGSGYWGQPDSIHSALVLACVALLGARRLFGSAACLSAGGLMKPLAAPLLPLLVLTSIRQRGLRGFLLAAGGGFIVAIPLLLPFVMEHGIGFVQTVAFQIERMPRSSVNGHNLWWLLGQNWQDATAPLLAGASATMLGLTLFALGYVIVLVRNSSWLAGEALAVGEYQARLLIVAASITGSFFLLSTHMHENHLLMTIPLLIAVSGRSRQLGWIMLGASLASMANMALHDLDFPFALGPLSTLSPVANPHGADLGHPYYTWLQVIGGYANSALITGLVAWIFASACRQPKLRGASHLHT